MARKAKAEAAKQQLNPEDELACFEEYSEKKGEIARISQGIAKLFERYKKMGVDTKAIAKNYVLSTKDDASLVMRSQLAQAARLQIIDFDADGQGSFGRAFDQKPSAEFSRKIGLMKVRADGYRAGFGGRPVEDCPHEPGTEELVNWRDQWAKGYADRQADGLDDVTVAEPRKRGRPRKARVEDMMAAGNA